MTIAEARQKLSKKEMDELTERALARGPFVIKKIMRIGSIAEVEVDFPEEGNRTELIDIEL